MEIVNAFVSHDTGELILLYRNHAGVLCHKKQPASFSTFHRELSLQVQAALRRSPYLKGYTLHTDAKGNSYTRVEWKDWEARKNATDPEGYLAKNNVKIFEGDVHPIRRYFCDNPNVNIQNPKRIYLDIETDSRVPFSRKEDARILSYALVDDHGEVISAKVLEDDTDESESLLLSEMWEQLEAYDQIVAWNGDRFDFPMIQERSKRIDMRIKFRRWLFLDHLLLFKRMNLNSSESGEEKQSMKLESVAQSILGEGKDDFDSSKTWEAWQAGGKERQRLLKYNIKDTVLLSKIEEKTGYIRLFQTLCDVCKCFPETRSLNPTVQMDGFMLSLGQKEGYLFNTKTFDGGENNDQYQGAFVMPPTEKGIVKNVHVGDFKSLYPSIIITWNMSPDTKGKRIYTAKGERPEPGYCVSPATGQTFDTSYVGILPTALKELIRLRKEWSDKRANLPPGTPEAKEAERRSTAYKVAANSFYGVLGSIYSRYYDRDIAESITLTGAYLIKQTIKAAEREGMRAIYGDTDSVFVAGVSKDQFAVFVAECNRTIYPKITADCICNTICLDCEKGFRRIVFTSAKRYAGQYSYYKNAEAREDSEPEIKGLEYKRGDIARLARRFQKKTIDMICKEGIDDYDQFRRIVEKTKSWLFNANLDISDVQIAKGLSKPLEDYTTKERKDGTQGNDLAHISVAKVLRDRGREVGQGTRIFYVVTDSTKTPMGVIPSEDYQGECDRGYLWEKLIYPPTMRFLQAAFPDKAPELEMLAKARPSKRVKQVPQEQRTLGISLTQERKQVALTPPFMAPIEKGTPLNLDTPKSRQFVIDVPKGTTEDKIPLLREALSSFPGKRSVLLKVHTSAGIAELSLPFKVSVTPQLLKRISEILNPG